MKHRKSILLLLLLAVIGLFVFGCGCNGGECPFRKLFGSKDSQTKQSSDTTTQQSPADPNTK